jgi:hypothetical protein
MLTRMGAAAEPNTHAKRLRRGIFARTDKPYAAALARARDDVALAALPKRSRWECRQIAAMPRVWGERLDALGATHRQVRWVAATMGHEHVTERLDRYQALVKLLSTTPPEERGVAFRELMDRMPKVKACTSKAA